MFLCVGFSDGGKHLVAVASGSDMRRTLEKVAGCYTDTGVAVEDLPVQDDKATG